MNQYTNLIPIFKKMPIADDEKDLILAKLEGHDFEFPREIISVLKIQWLSHPTYGKALLSFERMLNEDAKL